MRLHRLAAIAFTLVSVSPHGVAAGFWSWGSDSDSGSKEENVPATQEDPAAVASEATKNDKPPAAEDGPESDQSIDPLIAGFPNFVSWFRSHGGTGK